MQNFQSVCEWIETETNQKVRPYSTYDFGRKKDYNHCSVILPKTEALNLIQKGKDILPEGVLVFIGTSTWLGDEQHDGVELVIGHGHSQWDKLRIARSHACNSNLSTEDLIAKLQQLDKTYGIEIFHAETDTIGIEFVNWPALDNLENLCQDLCNLCPDLVLQHFESVETLQETINALGFLYLWWD